MTTLANYETDVADLLHDPAQQYWSLPQLDRYINQARTKLVEDTGCLRTLQTVYTTAGVEAYSFGQITGASIVSGGTGYSTPTVAFTGGGGSGAAATLTVAGGAITAINFTSYGSGYTSAPAAVISGGGGVNALAIATTGFGYLSQPSLGFSGGGGSGAAGTVSLKMVDAAGSVAGAGYSAGDVLTLVGGTFTRPGKVTVLSAGAVNLVSILDPGDYSVLPGVPVSISGTNITGAIGLTGGTGAGGTIFAVWGLGAATVTAPGAGYSSAPAVAVTGGSAAPTPGTVTATIASGSGASILVSAINANTYDVIGFQCIWGSARYGLQWRAWSEFSLLMRSWTNRLSQPAMWAVYGDTQIYIGPIPDQSYPLELDSVILPTDLSDYVTVDPIPVIAQSPIKYYAAYLAKLNKQSFGEAEVFLEKYTSRMQQVVAVYTGRTPNPYQGLK